MKNTLNEQLTIFLDFSVVLTAFSTYKLQGTGQVAPYYNTLIEVVGEEVTTTLLNTYETAKINAGSDEKALEQQIRILILSDPQLGPITRNIIKMWYLGTWYQLPSFWKERYGTPDRDETFVVSATAYTEGLLWPAVGSHPPGAKAPGYGTWADAPEIEMV